MLFGDNTRPISDFLPRVLAHIDGVDVDMAGTYAMDAVIQFLRDTKTLKEIVCFKLVECVNSYKINTKNRITEVLSVRIFIDGSLQPSHFYQFRIEDSTFYIDDIPFCASSVDVEIEVAVAPYRDSDCVPDFVYEDWSDAITALTLAKLYLLTDNEWYNPQAANNQMLIYQQLVRQARFTNITKHKPFNMRLSNIRRR